MAMLLPLQRRFHSRGLDGGQIATSAAYNFDYELSLYAHASVHIHAYVGSLNLFLFLYASTCQFIVRVVFVENKNTNFRYF